jgi:hypothetical protein
MRRTALAGLVFFLALAHQEIGFGAFEERPSGGRALALGGGAQGFARDLWSAVCNPAFTATFRTSTLGAAVLPAPYGFVELSRYSVALVFPVRFGHLGLYGSGLGSEIYREFEAGIGFGREVLPRTSVGIAVRGYFLTIKGYGSAFCTGLAAGLRVALMPTLEYGILVDNFLSTRIGSSGESLPQMLATTVAFKPSPGFQAALTMAKDSRFPLEASGGIEFSVAEVLHLRGGCSIEPMSFSGGFGLSVLRGDFDFGARWHTDLGMVYALSLSIRLGDG